MDLERLPLQAVTSSAATNPSTILSEGITGAPLTTLDLANLVKNLSDDMNGNHLSSDDSDSESGTDSEKDESTDFKSFEVLGKRRRIQPIKYSSEFSAKKQKTTSPKKSPVTRLQTPKLRKLKTSLSGSTPRRARGSRCGKCEGCLRSDCGKCIYCRDKPKYGGPGKKKQRCALRSCSHFERKGCSANLNSSAGAKMLSYASKDDDAEDKDTSLMTISSLKVTPPMTMAAVKDDTPPTTLTALKVTSPTIASSPKATPVSSLKPATLPTTTMPDNILPGISASSTPVSLLSILTTKETKPNAKQDGAASSKQLVNAKQALSSNQVSYAKVAELAANTRQLCDQLKHARSSIISPVHSTPASTSTSRVYAIPPIPPLISSLSNTKLSFSPSNTQTTTLLNKPVTISKVTTATSPRPITITKIAPGVESKFDAGASVSIGIPPSTGSSDVTTTNPTDPADRKLVCIQCGQERILGVTRSSKFCTQRCIINWLDANPGKTPRDAVGEDSSSGKQDSPKPLPRALKNLQIDMAKPGTKLAPSESESECGETKNDEVPVAANPTINPTLPVSGNSGRDDIIKSLVSMISHKQQQQQKLITSPIPASFNKTENSSPAPQPNHKVTLGSAKTSTPKIPKVTAKGAVKRSINTNPQVVITKKHKVSAQGSQKSVSFNLDSAGDMSGPDTPLSLKLDKIASYLRPGPKMTSESIKIKLPQGLPSDIRKWTVAQVVEYFKSTADCHSYVDLFETQEVDGIALLLLTHETLVKCLGIKLGRAVKIMNRVMELKLYQDNHN